MSETNLIYIIYILFISIFLSWVFFIYSVRKQRKINERLIKKVSQAKKIIAYLKQEALSSRRQSEDAAKSAEESAEIAKQMVDCFLDQEIPLEAMSNLNDSQRTLIDQLETLSHQQSGDDREKKQLKIHVATLKAQAQATETMIERLKQELEANRYRLTHLESKLQKSEQKLEHFQAIRDKAKHALSQQKALSQQIQHQEKQLVSYQALEQQHNSLKKIKNHLDNTITQQHRELEQSQEKISNLQSLLEQSQFETYSAIDSLNISEANVVEIDEIEMLNNKLVKLEDEVKESTGALERANREKEFLETQFLEMIDSLEQAKDAKHELSRVKKEYSMLEERFIMMHEDNA